MSSSRQDLIVGWHAVTAALNNPQSAVTEVWLKAGLDNPKSQRVEDLAQRRDLLIRRVNAEEIEQHAEGLAHQGVLVLLATRSSGPLAENDLADLLDGLQEPPFLLVLDGVQDPHNLGACLRTADAAGVHAVIVPRDRAAGLTPVVRKAAAGAAESVALIQVTNLARCLRELKARGIWLVGLAGEAKQTLYQLDLKGPLALILGAEGEGLRRLTAEECDHLACLPMQGTVGSLNVSVASGVALYEALRQRSAGSRMSSLPKPRISV
ncbi:MAG: 23S rRNA (guanosine(2251)-2'-O)-methyltransferase RlmB [Nevskiales bacterium]